MNSHPKMSIRALRGRSHSGVRSPQRYEYQAGQSLVIVALLLVVLAGMLGLAIDGGRAFYSRRQAQNAADAASLAAVRKLAADRTTTTETEIWNVASNLASSNRVNSTDVVATFIDSSSGQICTINQNCGGIPNNATGVRVTATVQLEPYFISVLIGNSAIPVSAGAAAQSGTPSVATDLKPMAVYCADPNSAQCSYQYDQLVALMGSDDAPGTGSFQWLDFSQPDPYSPQRNCSLEQYLRLECKSGPIIADKTNYYYNNLIFPAPPNATPWIVASTGTSWSNGVRSALNCWDNVNSQNDRCWMTNPNPVQYPGYAGPINRKWIVPLFNLSLARGSNLDYHTFMFAEFEFFGYWSKGQCNWPGRTTERCSDFVTLYPQYSQLATCVSSTGANSTNHCLAGFFRREVLSFPLYASTCNMNGIDICAIGMSE